jgi:predicted oxidoreductase
LKTYRLPHTDLQISRLAYGCMLISRRAGQDASAPAKLLATALEHDINFFDHANIYDRGQSEAVFGEALKQLPGVRQQIILQSKCGIRFKDDPRPGDPGRYDFSYAHIMESVEGSLRRLQTDYLDLLLLHRPDPLVEPQDVARAFDELHAAGKVRYFGVSNHSPAQMELLKQHVTQPLVVNQLEVNLLHSGMIREGMLINQDAARYTAADGLLDYCRLNDILVQAWSPVAGGQLIDPPRSAAAAVRAAAAAVARLAAEKHTSREAIALGWLLRHPAGIQPIIGTTNVERLRASCQADAVTLTREEWYTLVEAARSEPVP